MTKPKDRWAAKLIVRDCEKMTPAGRKALAAWLREQAVFLLKKHELMGGDFTVWYHY